MNNADWFVPVLLSACCLGGYDLCKKQAVKDNSVLMVLFLATLSGSSLYVVCTSLMGVFGDMWKCSWNAYWLVWIKSLIVGSSWMCVYYSLLTLPLSIAAPIRATSPFWALIGAMFLYNEIPGLLDGAGMLLIFAGYYGFSVMGHKEGLTLRKSRGLQLIIIGTLLGAASGLYDKYLINVLGIPPGTVQLHFSIDLVLLFGAVLLARRLRGRLPAFHWCWQIPLSGILLIMADFLYFYAVSRPDIHISQVSLVRRFSCVITFFLGAAVFKEKNMRGKALALVLIVCGIVMLALF